MIRTFLREVGFSLLCVVFLLPAFSDASLDALKAKITADVAAKVPIKDILKGAIDSGMSIEEAVTVIIQAGADPSLVVYSAIVDAKLDPSKVVEAAIKAGVPLDIVVNSAILAGADKGSISDGAIKAGVSPSVVATAIANATGTGAPVFGYTPATTPPAPALYVPTTPVVMGGGGGTTPSASPSKPK